MTAPSTLEHVTTSSPETKTSHGSGDHEMYAHIVKEAGLTEAYVLGGEIEALCGKRWIPTRDPKNYPLCGTCKDLVEAALGEPFDAAAT